MKRCRNPGCKRTFEPQNTLQLVCSTFCGVQYARTAQGEKAIKQARRRELREYRSCRESLSSLHGKAQKAFNAFVRARDYGLPCISCGKLPGSEEDLLTGSRWDAGHYVSVGAMPTLRYEPLNCHLQCVRCNRDLSGNTVFYRKGLLKRIGKVQLAWLEGPHEPHHWTREELRDLAKKFSSLARSIKTNG